MKNSITVEIEDYHGNTIGSFIITFDPKNKKSWMDGNVKPFVISNLEQFNIADVDVDDIYDTDNSKVRLQLNKIVGRTY
jgi:hypothetical protein